MVRTEASATGDATDVVNTLPDGYTPTEVRRMLVCHYLSLGFLPVFSIEKGQGGPKTVRSIRSPMAL